jgi:galactose mutarotase-like enzyme
MTEPLRITSGDIAATISPLGAELQTVTDAAGRDLLWNGDPAVWAGRAPILFPIVGTLRDDTYRLDGQSFTLPRHGFARRSVFEVAERAADRAVFRLEDSAATHAVYPFSFRLDLIFAVVGARLSMTGEVSNTGARDLPAGFGFHPAFLWPLPGGTRQGSRIIFNEAEDAPIRRLGGDGLVDPAPVPTPIDGRVLALDDSLFTNDAIIMTEPRSRRLVYGAPGGTKLAIAYEDFPQLGIWSKPGAPYVCIEPWQSFADFSGFSGTLFDKPGIVRLPPGQTRRWTMSAEVLAG